MAVMWRVGWPQQIFVTKLEKPNTIFFKVEITDLLITFSKKTMKIKQWTPLSLSVLATLSVLAAVPAPLSAQAPALGVPMTTVPVAQTGITIRLVNQTSAPITYEALGDTQPRSLMATADVTLQQLNAPTTLTFFYQDIPKDRQLGTGLLQATLAVDEATGILDVIIRPTNVLDDDVSNLTVEENGNVFVF